MDERTEPRTFPEVVDQMLEHIPEGKTLAGDLRKIMDGVRYLAPERMIEPWGDAAKALEHHLGRTPKGWQIKVAEIFTERKFSDE